jgi:predicted Zn-dependent protease
MAGLFYSLGRLLGPKVRKGQWIWESVAGSEADSLRAERQVGRDLAAAVRAETPPDADAAVRSLVGEVGARLARCVANKARRFDFEVLAGGEPNAFALPGGYVFITRSLVELCEMSPDELAFILGHEMAHVMRGHALDRILSQAALRMATRVAPSVGAVSAAVKGAGLKALAGAYSRDNELEADELGLRLADAAGFDPAAAQRLMQRLAALHGRAAEGLMARYFGTHPAPADRARRMRGKARD